VPDDDGMLQAEMWAVVEGRRRHWRDSRRMTEMHIVAMRKTRPETIGPNQHAVRVQIQLADTAFVPTAVAEVQF